MVVSLTLNHRRKPTVGRADPPVVPVTDEISPNKNFQFIRGQAFRIVAVIESLTLNHRRKPTVGRADPPVVPVTDEISPNKNFQFIRGQAFRIVAVIEKLAFHSDPHAFTSSIIVAPAASTVIVNVNDVPKGTFQNHMRLPRSWTSWDFGASPLQIKETRC